jgi:tetratricopeptide (TPR) repeat protein
MNYQEYPNDGQNPYMAQDSPDSRGPLHLNSSRPEDSLAQNIVFQYERTAKICFETARIDQGLESFEKGIEELAVGLENGTDNPIFIDFVDRTVNYLNQLALQALQIDNLRNAFKILEKCSEWTHPERYGLFPALRSLTYNHLGCCFRRQGRIDKAQYHLEKALTFLQALERADISGMTHVNLCAVFSQMGE